MLGDPRSGCWLWNGSLNGGGYGAYRGVGAHRWSYERYREAIPVGMTIDHLCKVRMCVNPDHLEVVTGIENNLRGNSASARNARAIECPKGHPYSGDNLYHRPDGGRGCMACRKASNDRSNALARAKRRSKIG